MKAAKFMMKVKGDSADKIFDKVRKQVGPVEVCGSKTGCDVTIDAAYSASAKSFRAALMLALKLWQADQ